MYTAALLLLLVNLTGCLDFSGSDVEDKKIGDINTVIWSAEEHNNDIPLDKDWEDGYSILYNSLNEGDILILKDMIDDIYYNKENDETNIIFEWEIDESTDYLELFFEGDITFDFLIGDRIEITLEIQHVQFKYEGFDLELEIFKGQWESTEYFNSDVERGGNGFRPLPADLINIVYE